MKWYLAKLIYRIICGEGVHKPQFDEQLRLILAEDDFHAFQKARLIGEKEEDKFYNETKKPVQWKFIDITELHPLSDLTDGVEIYSKIGEKEDAINYINQVSVRSKYLHDTCLEKYFDVN
ncbi:MAG: DUF4288 domain-containing protein [Ginsengibacter sp.]